MASTIRNPIEWGYDQVKHAASAIEITGHAVRGPHDIGVPEIRRIAIADLWDALRQGIADFGASRSDIVFLCLLYPAAGLVLGRVVFGTGTFALLFPLVSGFALIAPFLAVGVYEMSRQREDGHETNWASAFNVIRAPSFGAILTLGVVLTAIFLLWLAAAQIIYDVTMGPVQPVSMTAFLGEVLTTAHGWTLIVLGVGVGFCFALFVFAISVVSFPLLLDRDVGIGIATLTSIRAVIANPIPMAVWGLIIAAGLVIGSLPFLLGLVLVLPILGHASWHLYRKVVAR